ncbi:MAG: class I SAM-dependent methyltransferase [Nanoarchaeota archaeon]|nr:class I SAM-dependent methyltransferase [Nanoarchaeota archaeon]MBU1135688.1 class I SAM-dependent methyltransferase [Nanoarchaeota archaeon]MBU2520562.1 class I SAM-dependent methyltransferase [Nanoarchaeota archaeon]
MKEFHENDQERFWSDYNEEFSGDLVSNVVIRMSRKYIGKRILDVGAGSGALAKKVNATAIDLVPKGGNVIKGDCTNLQFENHAFDTVFCTELIEHLNDQDLEKCLKEINRVLKPDCYAVFTTNYDENLKASTVTCPDCGSRFHKWGHCQSFSEKRIKDLLIKEGFEIVELKKLNLGFVAVFNFLAKIFYKTRMDKLFKNKMLQKNLFIVARKS